MAKLNYIDLKVRLKDIPFNLQFINNSCVLRLKNNSQFPLQNFRLVVASSPGEKEKEFNFSSVIMPNSDIKQLWSGLDALDSVAIIKYEYIDDQQVIQVVYNIESDTYEWRNLLEGDTLDHVIAQKQKVNRTVFLSIVAFFMLILLGPIIHDEISSYFGYNNYSSKYSSDNFNSSNNYGTSEERSYSSMPYVSYEDVHLSPISIDEEGSPLYNARAYFTNRSTETIKEYYYTVSCYPSGEQRHFVMLGTTRPGEESAEMEIFPDEEMIPYEVVYSYDNVSGYEITVTYNFSTKTYTVLDSELKKTLTYKGGELVQSE